MTEKIGIGIITCNRVDFFNSLQESILQCCSDATNFIVVNDGIDNINLKIPNCHYIHNKENQGVGKSKNIAMQHLLDAGCEYIFILEDDLTVINPDVFKQYIKTSKVTGIQHFNFGPGTPFNRAQSLQGYDLHNRHQLSNISKPCPKMVVEYNSEVAIDLYSHVAGVFSFFTSNILKAVGLNDEQFYNAWEHVDHTLRIIKSEGHPPFWWFADIHNSTDYLSIPSQSIEKSTTSQDQTEWLSNVHAGRELYKRKHGFYPNMCKLDTKDEVIKALKAIKIKWTT